MTQTALTGLPARVLMRISGSESSVWAARWARQPRWHGPSGCWQANSSWQAVGGAALSERQALVRLLELPDPLLADYVFGHATAADPELADLVAAIRRPQGISAWENMCG